jgi:hypothetical protein
MLIHNANVTGSMHLNGMDMSSITGSVSSTTFNQYTSSTNEFIGSTNTRITNLDNASGSFSTRVTSLESFSASLDATFATDAQLTSLSSSVTQRLAGDESTITNNSSSFASRLTTDESNISSLQTASGSFSTRTTSNESNISSLQTASGSFSTRTTNLETASGSFSTRTTSNESNISSLQTASGSFSTRVTSNESNISSLNSRTGSYATIEGPNSFNGNQTVTGSLFITQNLTVLGSSSISYVSQSNLNIGTNLITVNAQNPSVRFGGLAVIDSGSSPQVSGSWLFDSIQNRWIMIHEQVAGAAVTSSIALMGPETYNNLGNETTITLNRIIKGSAGASGEHVGDSQISDDGTTVSIPGRLVVTGSITGSLDGSNITNSSISNAKLANSSVTVTAGTGLSGGGSVALGSSITLTNAAPDQTVTLTNGSNITITGTYPNFTLTNGVTNNNQLTNGAGYITGINSSAVTTALGYTPVTNARTLTINGTAYDLSADRSWTIAAGVSSITAGTGISTSGTSNVTITNTGVTSNVAGTGISISGGTGAVTITNTGLLSGAAGTGISVSTSSGNLTITNSGVTSNVAGTGISVSGATGAVTITNSGVTSITAGSGISISGATGGVIITNTITNNNQLTNGAGYITGITSGNVTTALGYTPYNSSNPSGYITGLSFDGLSSKTGGSGTYQTSGDFRAPIFYDSNNTGYYLDPASTSNLNILSLVDYQYITGQTTNGQSHYQWEGATYRNPGGYTAGLIIRRDNSTTGLDGSYPALVLYNNNGSNQTTVAMSFATMESASGGNAVPLGGIIARKSIAGNNGGWSSGDLTFYVKDVGTRRDGMTIYTAGYVQSDYSFRSPIYYDSNNTGYYIDAASTSNLNALQTYSYQGNGNVGGTGAASWHPSGIYSGGTQWLYGDIYRNGAATYGGGAAYYTIMYDNNDTGYYLDPNSYSSMWGIAIRGDNSAFGTTNQITFWGGSMTTTSAIGFKANGSPFTNPTGNGDGYNTYLTMDTDGRGWVFRRGVGGTDFGAAYTSGWILNNGVWQANASMRSPIFYDSNNTGYYIDPNSVSNINRIQLDYNMATGVGNNSFNVSKSLLGSIHIVNGAGPSSGDGRQAGITFMGGSASESQAGIYVGNNNSVGTYMGFATTDSYATGPQLFMTATNGGLVDFPRSYVTAGGSFRAPIFYDSNDTGYYLDPNSLSRLFRLQVIGDWSGTTPNDGAINIRGAYPSMTFRNTVSNNMWLRHMDGSGDIQHYFASGVDSVAWSIKHTMFTSGVFFSAASMRSPIFYDSDNTGYYIDAASTSNLNSVSIATLNGYTLNSDNYLGKYGNTYYQVNTWLQMNGNHGVFWPSYYGLHIYPNNDGSYGSLGILGDKNGWRGIHFGGGTGMTLMMNEGEFGFHRQSVGWTARFTSGTGHFNISGSATSANYSSYLSPHYNGGVISNPQVYFNNGIGLKVAMTGHWSVWSDTVWVNGYTGADVPWMCALHFLRNSEPRFAISAQTHGSSSYGTIYEVITSYNIASQTVANTNSISSAVGGGYTWTGLNYFRTNFGGYCGSLDSGRLQAYSDSNNSAFFSFHKSAVFATNMGLDADNVIRIGGWSAAANRWQLDMSGNMTVAGDVTAYSDARVKTNIQTIENALEKTLALRGVTYNRTDSEDTRTKVGVIAQEIIEVLPEVVNQDNDGMYNVSYGNITALLIEAIKEQQSQIEELKSIINGLTK